MMKKKKKNMQTFRYCMSTSYKGRGLLSIEYKERDNSIRG